MFEHFNAVTAARREHPTEDLASAIAPRIDGQPLSDFEAVSYYPIVATTFVGGLKHLPVRYSVT
ncbi:hypothetical protein LAUMK191_03822 [Mycobacterium attenuatum]|uniref:Uncharacterized protein n=1 Tax=Mycobacterium attenuatum TaxID=2341086 RepID=A0A498Q886_9MYCO|nr:hypothetical protein LAUMK136_03848 [Mycobacterium attenuatum]VBA57040.1 hypothetical protein LAUMK191_03822 [Mycobacterium attenuatum]